MLSQAGRLEVSGKCGRCSLVRGCTTVQGVCKLGGFTIFCARALPGEVLRARITAVKKSHALVGPSPARFLAPVPAADCIPLSVCLIPHRPTRHAAAGCGGTAHGRRLQPGPGDTWRFTGLLPAAPPDQAEKLVSLVPHSDAVPARCAHYGQGCGGCAMQDLAYPAQLRAKRRQVRAHRPLLLLSLSPLSPAWHATCLQPRWGKERTFASLGQRLFPCHCTR